MSRWIVAFGLVILLSVSAFGGAVLTHAFTSKNAGGQPITPVSRPTGIKAEGDWFQRSHFNNKVPPANARQLALQQAAKLPVSRIGATVRNGATNTTSPAGSWTPLGPQPINAGQRGRDLCQWAHHGACRQPQQRQRRVGGRGGWRPLALHRRRADVGARDR